MDYKKLEIKRQLFHMISGLLGTFLYYKGWLNLWGVIGIFAFVMVVFFAYKKKKFAFVDFFIRHFERPDTDYIGKGLINFLIGGILLIAIFEPFGKNIVLASLMILSLGDSISPIIGLQFGRYKINLISKKKYIEGIIVGIVLSTLGANLFVPLLPAFLASLAAMLVEAIEIRNKIDDNILIPLVSGIVLYLLI